MVKIMVNAASQQKPAFSTDRFGEDGQFGTLFGGCTFGNASGISRLRKEPSFSTFWSAVALGALAKGSPFEAVRRNRFASVVLIVVGQAYPDFFSTRASAILTYLYSFMGNMTKFREYLALSEYFLQASIDQGSTDIHSVRASLHRFPVHLVWSNSPNCVFLPPPDAWLHTRSQLEKVATEGDLYPFIAQSFRVFDEAVYAKAQERCAGDLERFYSWGPSHRIYDTNDPLPGEVSEAIMAVFETTNSLEFEPLQETVDSRQNIRAGVGDLLINGTLLFENAAKGDLRATLEKLDRSIEVYERYPGLCRCIMGSHTSHMLLGILAAIDDSRARRMYNRLRGTFNSCLASHTVPIPPLDEWQGMAAICNDLHCRCV
ncbi:unnamed protein product [Hapterophycus canaliculatus]